MSEGVWGRARARRYMTCVEEGGSKGQGQQEQDEVEEGGLRKSAPGKPMQGTEAPEHNKKEKLSCSNWKFKADKDFFTDKK